MATQYTRAPHVGGDHLGPQAPNAALLIDFDNVTMGMRSDLSKDLKKLLQSDVIRGKVTVQRAYADWRRYPQYIVPLSENSIDLIFAPAYGSSKKNATDIRMAIDAIELVFTRPEIGTYILLTGDSDFSSCVLKLKEYGKYVIGVGIQESSSDILVQNCDEYYSYTSLAGLQKTTETDVKSVDPWVLVERAVKKMADRGDVMRSDRLKQVMIDLDPTFNEGTYGFSKFSKFVTEAASKNILALKKMPNGQYEVTPGGAGVGSAPRRKDADEDRSRGRSRRGERRGGGDREEAASPGIQAEEQTSPAVAGVEEPREPATAPREPAQEPREPAQERREPAQERREPAQERREEPRQESRASGSPEGLDAAYALLRDAMQRLREDGREPVRDSDVKRKMLELDAAFDESTLGFSKFSRFLRQAHDHEVVDLSKQEGGSYEVALRAGGGGKASPRQDAPGPKAQDERAGKGADREAASAQTTMVEDLSPRDLVPEDTTGRKLGPRGGTTRRRAGEEEPPPLFEGQGRPATGSRDEGVVSREPAGHKGEADLSAVELDTLKLPQDPDRIVRYLTSYKGVGEKTAQQVVDQFGAETFRTLHENPEALKDTVPAGRVDQLVAGWEDDLRRRAAGETPNGSSRGRRGGRSRRGGSRSGRGGDKSDG